MQQTKVVYTYEDYCRLSDDERYQVFDGFLMREPAPHPYHQSIGGTLYWMLYTHITKTRCGLTYGHPVDVVLSDTNVLQPDVLFIARGRFHIIEERCIRGAPDLVAEVLSPSTAERDRTLKAGIYGRFGVKECWILDPKTKTVEVLAQGADGTGLVGTAILTERDTLATPLIPGLSIDLREVFRDPTKL